MEKVFQQWHKSIFFFFLSKQILLEILLWGLIFQSHSYVIHTKQWLPHSSICFYLLVSRRTIYQATNIMLSLKQTAHHHVQNTMSQLL